MTDLNEAKSGIAAIISVGSAGIGSAMEFIGLSITQTQIDVYLQQMAWVAILAGVVSIVNGTKKMVQKIKCEPKWDIMATLKIPLNFKNIRFSLKVGKKFLKRLKLKL